MAFTWRPNKLLNEHLELKEFTINGSLTQRGERGNLAGESKNRSRPTYEPLPEQGSTHDWCYGKSHL